MSILSDLQQALLEDAPGFEDISEPAIRKWMQSFYKILAPAGFRPHDFVYNDKNIPYVEATIVGEPSVKVKISFNPSTTNTTIEYKIENTSRHKQSKNTDVVKVLKAITLFKKTIESI